MPKKPGKRQSSKTRVSDPHFEREAQKYDRPVPSREVLLKWLDEASQPLKADHLMEQLGLEEADRVGLERRLKAMVRDGQLLCNRRGGYGVAKRMDLIAGRVIGHADGFGFVARDADGDDIYLRPSEMRRVLHGDRVLVSVTGTDRRGRDEGSIVEILERANETVVGRYFFESGVGVVIPDESRIHQDILIPADSTSGAAEGQFVVAEVTRQPEAHRQPTGKIIEILGDELTSKLITELAIRSHGLPHRWPAEVSEFLDAVPDVVTDEDIKGRKDIRDLPLVTIDGADARDFDDAVYCERKESGWRLLVAIADVSHYVKPGSVLDKAALERATSVYFPGRVVPMLPEALSNGICSLNPDVDRLCMVCEMRIDLKGQTKSPRFYTAVMRSHARLTYDAVWQAVGPKRPAERKRFAAVIDQLDQLYAMYQALRQYRERRGALDFDRPEVWPGLDGQGGVSQIKVRSRNDAHRLIEECMIAANVAAAKFLEKSQTRAPYRVHDAPPPDKLEDLVVFLGSLGLRLNRRGEVRPEHFSALLEHAHQRDDAGLIEAVVLRSQSLAVYSPDNTGHFGLALTHYAHFTSPIRRYADLVVHRAIKASIERKKPPKGDMDALCRHISMCSRRADEASRQVVDRLKCMYMQRHVGDVFAGTVTGVASFGLFVELDDVYVSGLVHVTSLPADYYHFDASRHEMVGERRGRKFRLADRLKLKVLRVDMDDTKVDLALEDD